MTSVATTVIAAALVLSVIYGIFSTGPNCPGMDPSYIGWCK